MVGNASGGHMLIEGIRTGTIHVFGFGLLQNSIQSMAGPQAIQPLASYIYGLYTALVYLARHCSAACSRTASWGNVRRWLWAES